MLDFEVGPGYGRRRRAYRSVVTHYVVLVGGPCGPEGESRVALEFLTMDREVVDACAALCAGASDLPEVREFVRACGLRVREVREFHQTLVEYGLPPQEMWI